ncbi:MAG: hypothetical protein JWR17_2179 [Pseudomonas sp.]|jgi:hypothetical protein|uniref:hypothetical protein n=1 Tax=Pseudomonas sp. TaxID=306 RepID=UPI002625A062|nr:hypothetical protein [Pseudomonas sp.]MDB6049433.1 hypothetical protein [Pseudomonas sp.]
MNRLKHFESFFDSRDITLLTDSAELAAHALACHIPVSLINELRSLPANSVCITVSRQGTESLFQLSARSESGRAIYTQAHAFDPALDSVIYTFEQMCNSDYRQAMGKQEELLALLDDHQRLCLAGPNSAGRLIINEGMAPYAMIEEDIQTANDKFIFPLAELLEVHYTHMDPDEPRSFTLNGEFQVAGILTARGYHDPSIPMRLIESLAALSDLVARHGASVIIKDSQLKSFRIAGRDYCILLNEATGPRGLHLTECAFGVNASIAGTIDYRINSQLNEGIEGMHIAVGDGRHGYHIDLLMPDVVAAPLPC